MSAPDFTLQGVIFRCQWIGDNGGHYEWQSLDGRLVVGRNSGSSSCWARVNGRSLGGHFKDLKTAMFSAIHAAERAAA
jgi:hypothetical protein